MKAIATFIKDFEYDCAREIGAITADDAAIIEIPYKIMEEKLCSFVKNTPPLITITGWDEVKKSLSRYRDSVKIKVHDGKNTMIRPRADMWLNNFKMWDIGSGKIPISKEFNKVWRDKIETPYNLDLDILWQFGKIFSPCENLPPEDWRHNVIARLKEVFYEEEFIGDIDEAIEFSSMGGVSLRIASETRWGYTPVEECEANRKVSKRTKKFARNLKKILEEEKILHHHIFGNCWIDE